MESQRDIERFIDNMKMGRLSKRDFHAGLASVGLGMTLMPFASGKGRAQTGEDPVCFTWAGYEVPEMHLDYIEKYGNSPNFSLWGDEEEAEARMIAGFRPDLTMPCSYKVRKWNDLGFLQAIDTDRLENWDNVIPALQGVPDMVADGNQMMVCAWWGLTSVTFRTDLAPEYDDPAKHTWGILWDPKYAGRLSMIDSLIDGVMVAAIYSGAADPFDMTPEEVRVTKDLMVEQRPLLRYYTNDATSWEQALASGELIAAVSWNSTPLNLLEQDIPVAFMKPKEGPMTWTCGISLMSFADPARIDRAYDLIDAFLAPNTGEFWVGSHGMGHANIKTYQSFSAAELEMRGLPPEDVEGYIRSGIFQATIRNEPELQEMYEEVKAGF
ncbi:MAG: extracellular solute-binding protein [Rhodospirillales bacterium]|nr:extracellular solute-binding protein [Rhodospirillales bacterium]